MGLTICTFARVLGAARRWFAGRAASAAHQPAFAGSPLRPAGIRGLHTAPCRAQVAWPQRSPSPLPRRPLRVLRVVDAALGPRTAGRLVISGRMADVCAELDRLVALESAAA
ncbi:hypothetical protein PE066_00890 [Ramlibacter tataouinensis]|uniref:hypothetical protein n=1 Tax=Ramlibacter tataouinensis TaxID=94132 RepID=UPI0022F39289|nr:hypothetical protein [Ramlibacter tataouinensis]WBY02126.1 hypothetical protein PE066_00890 [Ramlibacter tataouinensis]